MEKTANIPVGSQRCQVAVIGDTRSPGFAGMQIGLAARRYLLESGCHVRMVATGEAGRHAQQLLTDLRGEGIVGAISLATRWLEQARGLVPPMPIVATGPLAARVQADCVRPDYDVAARQALGHLRSLGRRECGYVTILDWPHATACLRALEHHAREMRMWDSSLLLDLREEQGDSSLSTSTARQARPLRKFFQGRPLPMAMVTHNDYVAAALIEWLIAEGYRVPQDVAMVGADDDPFYAEGEIGLTTIAWPFKEMGLEAARLLLARLGERTPRNRQDVVISPRLVVRESTLVVDQAAPWIRNVLETIQAELSQPRLVKRLAAKTRMHESTLSVRFHEMMGCTVLEYRDRLRLQRAAQLLRDHPETKIEWVARQVGFTRRSRFAEMFRRTFGSSPHEYRDDRAGQPLLGRQESDPSE